MVNVTCMVDEDVLQKIDIHYIISKFSGININAAIIFICTNENYRKEDTWKKKGKTFYAIRLPYEQVKAMDDARPLMLEMAAQRLGIPVPGEVAAGVS